MQRRARQITGPKHVIPFSKQQQTVIRTDLWILETPTARDGQNRTTNHLLCRLSPGDP